MRLLKLRGKHNDLNLPIPLVLTLTCAAKKGQGRFGDSFVKLDATSLMFFLELT